MKKLFKNIIIFIILPFIVLFIIEVMLPPTFFTFRIWEAVSSKGNFFVGPFYPNVEYSMEEEGDLSHHTKYAVKKNVKWRTDPLGFRNNIFNPNPAILVIGDSNIAGSSLSQEETLSYKLNQYTGLSVYSLAPSNINTFIHLRNEGILQTPKILVLAGIERNVLALPLLYNNPQSRIEYMQVKLNPLFQFFAVPVDKLIRINSFRYLKSRIRNLVSNGIGTQSAIDEKMFFLQGRNAVIKPTEKNVDQFLKRINNYKDYCDSIECQFIYIPIPNKETLFWELAGLKEMPTFVDQINNKLKDNGIITIETTKLFKNLLDKGILPYHYDDTHWNKHAVDIVAKELSILVSGKVLYIKEEI